MPRVCIRQSAQIWDPRVICKEDKSGRERQGLPAEMRFPRPGAERDRRSCCTSEHGQRRIVVLTVPSRTPSCERAAAGLLPLICCRAGQGPITDVLKCQQRHGSPTVPPRLRATHRQLMCASGHQRTFADTNLRWPQGSGRDGHVLSQYFLGLASVLCLPSPVRTSGLVATNSIWYASPHPSLAHLHLEGLLKDR